MHDSQSFGHLGQDLNVTSIPLDHLKPHKNNPRTHSKKQIEQLAASMKEFGWTKGDRLAGKEFIKMVRQASVGEKESFEELMQVIIDSVKNLEHLDDEEFQNKSGATKEDVTAMLAKLLIHKGNRFPDT